MDHCLITIFTPTYNRASLLPRLYKSLTRQTNKEFVWIVVDDGSSDDTSRIVQEWVNEKVISIKYIFQQNAGKMKAHNRGVKECQTELFMCLDSDDYLSDDCVEQIYFHWKKYKENPLLSGMVAYRKMIGCTQSFFPNLEFSQLHYLHLSYKGETALVFRTSILSQNPFPEFEGEKFISEGSVYDKLDQEYLLAVIPEYWMLCEYQEEGYTTNSLKVLMNSPRGWAFNAKQRYTFFGDNIKEKIRWMSTYVCASLLAGYNIQYIIDEAPNRFLCVACLPIGWMQKVLNQRKVRK